MQNFESAEDAFMVGVLIGALITGNFKVESRLDDDGDYLPEIEVRWSLDGLSYVAVLEVVDARRG